MNRKLVIVGAGGHAKVCLDIARQMNLWKNFIFLEDDCKRNKFLEYEIKEKKNFLKEDEGDYDYFVAIGDNEIRRDNIRLLQSLNKKIVKLIHNSVKISEYCKIEVGTVIMPNVVVNSTSSIGSGVIINTGSIVEHDCVVGSFSHLSPGSIICGGVILGQSVWVGAGAVIIQECEICENAVIGANSTVTKTISVSGVYVGSPVIKL